MSNDLKAFLISQRASFVAEAEGYSSDLARRLAEHFAAWDALDKVKPDRTYAHFQYAIDAIRAYLVKLNRPASRDEIIAAVIAGGWREGDVDRRRGPAVNEAISHHLRNPKTKKIKSFPGEMVGIFEWEDVHL